MHIHHNPMTSGTAGIHSAGAAEKAAAAQRAAETRRQLLKSAAQIEGTLDAGELSMVGKWSEEHSGERERRPHNQQQNSQPDDEDSGAKPISVWA
jgi:hypothetical protein